MRAPAADGAFAQWKAFVKENAIDESKVKVENVDDSAFATAWCR